MAKKNRDLSWGKPTMSIFIKIYKKKYKTDNK
jgi:hypothetical protein